MDDDVKKMREQAEGGTFCIVPYCHPDFAWTHHREWHAERYALVICEALDLMRQHEQFRFCVEPWVDEIEPFLERCPDRVEELRERLNSGQMGVKAFTLTSPRPVTCPDETFLRNMILGRAKYREFAPQADLGVMACPDVGMGHSQMPQVVALAGGSMYRGWRSDSAFSLKGVPREFMWRGLDGTELMTSRGIYAGLAWPQSVLPSDLAEQWEEVVERLFRNDLARAMECSQARTWWAAQGMDDARPLRGYPEDQALPIMELVKVWNEREKSRMVFTTPGEYHARLEREVLPVWEGVIDPVDVAYNSGWHGQRGLWRLRQQLDGALVVTERACALARLAGADDVAGPSRLQELWTESVRIASHALQWVFAKDWDWVLVRARYALREAREETHRAVARLAGAGRSSDAARPLVLFNPLPYPREEIVEVPFVQPRTDAGGHRVRDADGNEVELQLGERPGLSWGRVAEAPLIFKAEVPAMGCALYHVEDAPAPGPSPAPRDPTADNGVLLLRLSARGLQEVRALRSGLQWRAPAGSCVGDCRLFEMGEGVLHVGPITAEISGQGGAGGWVLTGPIRWTYRWETDYHGHRVRQDVILDAGCRHVDFVTRVLCAGANGFFALCFSLPFGGEMHVDIPFGVEPRDLSQEPYAKDMPHGHGNVERTRENQFWARSFASVSDGDRGLSLISADGDKYWTYDAERRELRHILFTPLRDVEDGWEAWVTKDRLALGWHEFRHRLIFHDGDWRTADVCGASDRLRLPLQVVKPLGTTSPALTAEADQLRVEPRSVRVSAFYEASEGYVLRVYESAGEAANASVVLPSEFAEVIRTDFNLEPVGACVHLDGAQLGLRLRAWEVATVLLRR